MIKNPIICAIDTTDVAQAKALSQQLAGSVGALKLGLEFFTANGAAGVAQIASSSSPIFLDLKFHDIPNTVAGAVRATKSINSFMMTVHTVGGQAMMQAAKEAAQLLENKPLIVGVTILTSLDQNDLGNIGVMDNVSDQVVRLAELAQKSGLDGVVCSPHEIERIREVCGKDFTLVVPGIRPAGSASGDQKRVLTPKEAIDKGADYLVIGRPITESANPKAAMEAILASITRT